jgi:prophage maintenance system killer protein
MRSAPITLSWAATSVTETFLALNGVELTASDTEIVQMWSDLGAVPEAELADWIRGTKLRA